MAHDVLHGIVERQAKVYNELINRIIELSKQHGSTYLTELIIALKKTYGLDEFPLKQSPIVGDQFRVRPMIYEDEVKKQVLNLLHRNKGRRFKMKDIFLNLEGRTTEYTWKKVKDQLIAEQQIKNFGLLYWVD